MKKNPIESATAMWLREVDRKLFCAHYDTCLDEAIRRGWSGFSCKECAIEARTIWSDEEAAIDALRCAVVVGKVCTNRPYYVVSCERQKLPQRIH
jgi:hypothetical protein